MTRWQRFVRWLRRVIKCGKILARDSSIPGWLRWLFVFGVMPVPLCLDEIALVLAVGIMAVFYRNRLMLAWRAASFR